MSFKIRLILTYVFVTASAWGISWGMETNGAARASHALYERLCLIRLALLLGPVSILAFGLLFLAIEKLESKGRVYDFEDTVPSTQDSLVTTADAEERRRRIELEFKKAARDKAERIQRAEDAERKRKLVAEEKKSRSAHDAARSALDDF